VIGKAALDRGYSVLLYEAPGQGEPLRKYGMKFTPEWEKPTAAVLDEFLRAHERPSKIVLLGMSSTPLKLQRARPSPCTSVEQSATQESSFVRPSTNDENLTVPA
jgi:hypothetical protein